MAQVVTSRASPCLLCEGTVCSTEREAAMSGIFAKCSISAKEC